jgi:hypothetical protein
MEKDVTSFTALTVKGEMEIKARKGNGHEKTGRRVKI